MSNPSNNLFPTADAFVQAQVLLEKHKIGARAIKMGKKQTQLSHSFLWIDQRLFAIAKKSGPNQQDHLIGKGGINKVKFCQDVNGQIFALRIEGACREDSHDISMRMPQQNRSPYHSLDKQQQTKMVLIKLGYFQACAQINQKSYLISSYFPGKDLGQHVVGHSWKEDLNLHSIILSACWEVKRIHDFNIIHGDIKPNNFILNDQGQMRLIDFDASILLSDFIQTYKPGRWICAQDYAAPEVKQKRFIHKASDLYSLGVTIKGLAGFSKRYQAFMMEHKITTWFMHKFFIWDEDVAFYENIAQELKKDKIEDRKPIEKIIQKIQQHHDQRKEKRYFRLGLVTLIAGALFISTSALLSSPIWLGVAMIPTLWIWAGYCRQRFMQRAFAQINDSVSETTAEINFEVIKNLTQEKRQQLKQGYEASQSVFSQAIAWAYPSYYNREYYAGLRLHDLAPQVDWDALDLDDRKNQNNIRMTNGSN